MTAILLRSRRRFVQSRNSRRVGASGIRQLFTRSNKQKTPCEARGCSLVLPMERQTDYSSVAESAAASPAGAAGAGAAPSSFFGPQLESRPPTMMNRPTSATSRRIGCSSGSGPRTPRRHSGVHGGGRRWDQPHRNRGNAKQKVSFGQCRMSGFRSAMSPPPDGV